MLVMKFSYRKPRKKHKRAKNNIIALITVSPHRTLRMDSMYTESESIGLAPVIQNRDAKGRTLYVTVLRTGHK